MSARDVSTKLGRRGRGAFELAFWGSASVRAYRLPRYRRHHPSLESAREAARGVYEKLARDGISAAAHPAIVYGPGLGPDGVRV